MVINKRLQYYGSNSLDKCLLVGSLVKYVNLLTFSNENSFSFTHENYSLREHTFDPTLWLFLIQNPSHKV